MSNREDTITAIATGVGGAISVIRLSGPEAIDICDSVFRSASGAKLASSQGYTLHYGKITDNGHIIDDVVVSVYRAPKSYTGDNMVEVSCHGSRYIQQEIVKLFLRNGARLAEAGEFTIRAFLAGKLDLSQAEAVADMIASTDRATHALASNQMRGGYSAEFSSLRDELLTLVSLLELELDFGEEDVEFADRSRLTLLIGEIGQKIDTLLGSFSLSNVIKEGVAVAIAGKPNVGKSTLLNALLKEDRAMVSDIAGTTRDSIEESINIKGVRFRFIDTAGIRATDDKLEKMGIERTFASIEKANIIILMSEACDTLERSLHDAIGLLDEITVRSGQKLYLAINKCDRIKDISLAETSGLKDILEKYYTQYGEQKNTITDALAISAKNGVNIQQLVEMLSCGIDTNPLYNGDTIVANSRHYEALLKAAESLSRACQGLTDGIAADLLSQDIRETLHHIGTITGEITTDEVLGSIFSKFCIGK